MTRSLAILLTVYNRKSCTLKCLQQILSQELKGFDIAINIYIVDGGSNDGTVEAVRNLFPDVHIKVNDGVYWNRGMYAAWEWASSVRGYDFYLWLNDDTFIYPFCISTLLEESLQYKDKAIIVGATVDSKSKSKQTYGGRLSNGTFPTLRSASEVHHFNGNIVLIPIAVFNKLGNLDPYFQHSKGDFDYGMRALKAGVKMYQAAQVLGECNVHPCLDKWCNPKYALQERWEAMHQPDGMPPHETFYFERKHLGLGKAAFHWLTIHIRCLFPSLWKR